MNFFDLVIAVIVGFYASMGVRRGLIRELFSFGNWVVAGVLSWMFADNVGNLFKSSIGEPTVRLVVGFITLFVVVFVGGTIAAHMLHNMFVSRTWLKVPNLILGGVTGAFRGLFIILIAVLLMGLTSAPNQSWWKGSVFIQPLASVALAASHYLPKDVSRHIRYN